MTDTVLRKLDPQPPSWAAYGPQFLGNDTWEWWGENPNGSSQFADTWPRGGMVAPAGMRPVKIDDTWCWRESEQ